jgi:putative transcriptional regulator
VRSWDDEMKNCVAELREARGWTKVELADRLNISRQSIHAIESGKYDPSLPLAFAIGKLFGKPVEEIFGDHCGKKR